MQKSIHCVQVKITMKRRFLIGENRGKCFEKVRFKNRNDY